MPASPCTLALLGPLPPGPTPDIASLTSRFEELLLCSDDLQNHLAAGLAAVAPLAPSLLGAVVATLVVARHDRVVVAGAGTAMVELELLERLADHDMEAPIVLARPDEPVPGRYHRSARRTLERALRAGKEGEPPLRGLRVATL